MSEKKEYKVYSEGWLLELIFAKYKGDECLTSINVQVDYCVIGEEFVNVMATILTYRMERESDEIWAVGYDELRRTDGRRFFICMEGDM